MDLVGTCNVLTLRTATRARDPATSVGASGPTRQQIIFRQFAEAGVCMFALQETRLQRINSLIHDYMVFIGAATSRGQCGTWIAISTKIPYGHCEDESGRSPTAYEKICRQVEAFRNVLQRDRGPPIQQEFTS